MIGRINNGTSLYGVLSYNWKKLDEGKATIIGMNKLCQSLDGTYRIGDYMKEFQSWLPSHFRSKKSVIHISLNPHPDDKLTDQQLNEIGHEYMKRLGFGDQPFLIFKHSDIEREHMHIVSLWVDSKGKRLSNYKYKERNVHITKELETLYDLIPAQSSKQSQLWQLTPVDITKGNLKGQTGVIVRSLAEEYRFQTLGEYSALLSLYNIGIEQVKGEAAGKTYEGLLYMVTDKEGKVISLPLKSSLFGKEVGLKGLEKKMRGVESELKTHKAQTGKIIDSVRLVVDQAKGITRQEENFKEYLKDHGIDCITRRTEEGRIYGITFIDHNTRTVLNGSRLGKQYAANAMQQFFIPSVTQAHPEPPQPREKNHPFIGLTQQAKPLPGQKKTRSQTKRKGHGKQK